MSYRLLYDDIDLGEVRFTDADFPSSFGIWTPAPLLDETPLNTHLRNYIEYSIESMRLLDATNAGPEWEQFAGLEEHKFQDLIDSEQWWLVEPNGSRIPILIPLFRLGGEITWRYDPLRTNHSP